jgi:coenzyme Q-binding protein COQ10
MPTHAEKKILPYSPEQMFDLVLDVERYPEFLPWCLSCEIIKQTDDEIISNLVIGYKVFREWFNCRVKYQRPNSIRVEYVNGPLRYLSNTWDFQPSAEDGCIINFYVDFEFKNPFFQKLMGVFFNEIVKRMVKAFEDRAKKLYGSKGRSKAKTAQRPLKKKES